ncbi:MAG: hypothetical protein ACPKPY_01425 [Nitrososphaeraceae archaeon]
MKNWIMCLYVIRSNDLVLHLVFKKENEYLIPNYETMVQIGDQNFWLWICIEPVHKSELGIHNSKERNMFDAEKFIRSQKYGKDIAYTNRSTWIHKHLFF